MGILLPALNQARKGAKNAATRAQLDSIGKANEQYKLAFGAYAGWIADEYWNADPGNRTDFTSTENLALSLMGRAILTAAKAPEDHNIPGTIWSVDDDQVGSGPITVAGQTYGAFYPQKKNELAPVTGTAGAQNSIRELSYGLPILYFRARGAWTRPASAYYGQAPTGAVSLAPVLDYTAATALANPLVDVNNFYTQETSLLNPAATGANGMANAVNNLARLVINETLSNLANGPNTGPPDNPDDVPAAGFFLMATGYDRIYFDRGGGEETFPNSPKALDRFDDIIISGGTAP
jgi:hypothetical protein